VFDFHLFIALLFAKQIIIIIIILIIIIIVIINHTVIVNDNLDEIVEIFVNI